MVDKYKDYTGKDLKKALKSLKSTNDNQTKLNMYRIYCVRSFVQIIATSQVSYVETIAIATIKR